jgi:glycosyltransferase involved in cell wall biosynthesis
LRIALFGARGIPHTYSGTETFFGELAPRLAARGHDVIVYCRRSLFREQPRIYRGVHLIYLPSIETKNLSTPTHTLACAFDVLFRNVDVMLVTNVANALHCLIPRLFGKQVALNVDGVEWQRSKWGPLGRRYFYWNAKLAGHICPAGIITDAVEMQRIYLEDFGTPSVCIAYGANVQRSTDPNIVRQYGVEPGNYYLIASRLVPENNADLIVRAFESTRSNKVLAIAGGANYRSEFLERLKQGRDQRVRFLGHIGDTDHVKELHCNCYAYIHGHSVGGTNPALLKALGYGNCVLALDTPFNRDVIDCYGVLFKDEGDLARKLRYLEEHPEEVGHYRKHAHKRILERYSWEKITDQYEDLFYRLTRGDAPALDRESGMYVPRRQPHADPEPAAVMMQDSDACPPIDRGPSAAVRAQEGEGRSLWRS